MTRRLSDWSKPGEKPPMVGVWGTIYEDGTFQYYRYWNGTTYGGPAALIEDAYAARNCISIGESGILFRGLADKPE